MCLGIPARLEPVTPATPIWPSSKWAGCPDRSTWACSTSAPGPGNWVLVHMGFALQAMTEAEAADALAALSAERDAEASAP